MHEIFTVSLMGASERRCQVRGAGQYVGWNLGGAALSDGGNHVAEDR